MTVTITLCTQVMKYYGSTEDLYALFITMCVLNAVFSVTAVAGNLLLLLALRKTTSLPVTSRILLQSLAFSDLAVGLLVHPLYILILVQVLQNYACNNIHGTLTAFFLISSVLSAVSFVTVTSVGVDRFLAISLHLRYHELITPRRVRFYVIAIWIFVLLQVLSIFLIDLKIAELVSLGWGFAAIFLLSIVYVKIYRIARHHQIRINNQSQVQAGNQHMARNRSLAMKTFYVFVVFLLCYLPYLVTLTFMVSTGTNVTLQAVIQLTTLLLFLNSSLNPVVFGWKMKEVRQVLRNELRVLFL